MTNHYKLDVEAFSLFDRTEGEDKRPIVHFEVDPDLYVTARAARGGGVSAGLVLVDLGIDGYLTHRVRVDTRPVRSDSDPEAFDYEGDRLHALDDAIEALTAVRDQLAAMRPAPEVQAAERNAFEIGRDAERLQVRG